MSAENEGNRGNGGSGGDGDGDGGDGGDTTELFVADDISPEEFEDLPPEPGTAEAASPRLRSIVESLLFAADKPLTLRQLGDLLGESELERVRAAVAAVGQDYVSRGVQLHSVAGGFQFRTNPENASWVQKLLAQKPVRLTRPQLETLAICAYRQPITRPEIDEIRGVDSGGTLKMLLERGLVRILGKKEEPGRPILYGTTREFLEFFNLRDLKDLPTLREFHELSEEHQAQVAALEGAAPAGSVETAEEAAQAAAEMPTEPLARLELGDRGDDQHELEEIDRMIQAAGAGELDATEWSSGAREYAPLAETVDDAAETSLHKNTIATPHIEDAIRNRQVQLVFSFIAQTARSRPVARKAMGRPRIMPVIVLIGSWWWKAVAAAVAMRRSVKHAISGSPNHCTLPSR